MDKVELGRTIRELRESKGYTQEKLAELANISYKYLGEIERGKKMPGLDRFVRIITALDVPIASVLRNELPEGKHYVYDDLTQKLEKLDAKQRKTVCDIIDAYLQNL